MTERYLIATTKEGRTKNGRRVAHLHSTDSRLKFPVLILFDLSMLSTVGIDPNGLTADGIVVRYWAYYEESKKKTSAGNPYKNVLYLERIDQPATATSTDSSATVAELREIKNLLQYIAHLLEGQDLQPPELPAPSSPPPDPPPTTNPALLDDPPMAGEFDDITVTDTPPPAAPDPALSVEEARNRFYALTGEAITLGMESRQVNAMIDLANRESFAAALAELENLVERMERDTALPAEPATRGKKKLFMS